MTEQKPTPNLMSDVIAFEMKQAEEIAANKQRRENERVRLAMKAKAGKLCANYEACPVFDVDVEFECECVETVEIDSCDWVRLHRNLERVFGSFFYDRTESLP